MKGAALMLLVALLQRYAARTRSGCEGFYPSLTECGQAARRYQREDTRALSVTGGPASRRKLSRAQ
jgi:hypothetical protein